MSLMASSLVDGKKNIDIVRAEKTVMRQHTRRDQTYPPVVRVPENPILFRNRKSRGSGPTGLYFWRLSLGNSWGLAKAMFARATSKVAGSEARGEGRERGYFD